MRRQALRFVAIMALLGVVVPLVLLGIYNLRALDPTHATVEQAIAGSLMPVLYPGGGWMGAMIGVEESEPRYLRESIFFFALSLVTNATIYALVGSLIVGARALVLRGRGRKL